MEPPLEKLVGKEVIIETDEHVVYSGGLTYCDSSKENKIKLKNAHVEYSPKLTAKQVLSQKSIEEFELPFNKVLEYEKIIPWRPRP